MTQPILQPCHLCRQSKAVSEGIPLRKGMLLFTHVCLAILKDVGRIALREFKSCQGEVRRHKPLGCCSFDRTNLLSCHPMQHASSQALSTRQRGGGRTLTQINRSRYGDLIKAPHPITNLLVFNLQVGAYGELDKQTGRFVSHGNIYTDPDVVKLVPELSTSSAAPIAGPTSQEQYFVWTDEESKWNFKSDPSMLAPILPASLDAR